MSDAMVWCWWSPGEPEDDLHGFVTREDRDACDRGERGPFKRVVRDHHKLGPVPPEVQLIRAMFDKRRDAGSEG